MRVEKKRIQENAWLQHLVETHQLKLKLAKDSAELYDPEKIGPVLKEARGSMGLTLDDVIQLGGGDVGLSRSMLSAIECGAAEIRLRPFIFLKELYQLNRHVLG